MSREPKAPRAIDTTPRRSTELQETQRAMLNLLEDLEEERLRERHFQEATMNLLEDVDAEKKEYVRTQQALMNILEEVEAERARAEQARILLEAVNAELEGFSYSVSHDLRAPLRAISGFSEAVGSDYAPLLDEEGKRYLRLIQESAHRMGRLIDDLLTFSRLGRQALARTDVDIESLARAVFEELVAIEPGRKIEFRIAAVPRATGDSAMIRQVLVNLFSNAIKFSKGKDPAIIEFGYESDAGEGVYFVRDNGVGFDMRYVDKLFGVFQRLHAVTDFEGTGVGLALVRRIITRHGGKVWAEGVVNQGAIFHFTLPGAARDDQRRV